MEVLAELAELAELGVTAGRNNEVPNEKITMRMRQIKGSHMEVLTLC